ncbi:hypothetical protein WBG78_29995 [Chryseolinea sp. T2]|uniref:hypothetical protein n=1 Tax=Chryseolinea sp. T2 TaxID=3129255 RepID=UPI00307879D2
MMGIRTSCILALLLLTFCSDDDEKFITLLDDDFDNSPGWQYVSTANHVGALDAVEFSSPSHSLKITALDTQANGFSFWSQNLTSANFPDGAQLVLKAKIKTQDVTGEGVFVALRCDSNTTVLSFETSQGTTSINGSHDFKEYTVGMNAIPSGTTNLYVFLIMSGTSTGSAYFDDVSLVYKK